MRRIFIIIFCLVQPLLPLFAQPVNKGDFITLYNQGKYDQVIEITKSRLASIYVKKDDKKKLSFDFIPPKETEEVVDLNELFRKRKAEGFFIEDNNELSTLHLYSARSYFQLSEYDAALNHFYQALRFKHVEFDKDDIIYYEISQVYKALDLFAGYTRALETAYTLNPKKYEYSLELGKTLKSTNSKKKAIYHLERYVKSRGDELDDPDLFLLIGNLNEDIGRYLETEKYYKKYLEKRIDDGYIHFALGYLAFKRTGDYELAIDSFDRSLTLLPEKELLRRSKAFEYKGDIKLKELEFEKAADFYLETVQYQDKIKSDIKDKIDEILKIKEDIQDIKTSILNEKKDIYNKYIEYKNLQTNRGEIQHKNKEQKYEFEKLNAGKIRWNLAESYERMGKLEQAVKYYREAISFNYNSNSAREKILKLELKMKRGY